MPQFEVREFYFTRLKLPYHEWEKLEHPHHKPDETILNVMEMFDSLDDRPSGIVIFRDELWFEVVDTTTGERIRLTFGELSSRETKQQCLEALIQLALLDTATISKGFVEVTNHLERKDYRAALQTFHDLDSRVKFLGAVLEIVRKNTRPKAKQKLEEINLSENILKTVLVLDTETKWFKPLAHNLSAARAVEIETEEAAAGKTVKTIDQEKNHKASTAEKCKACKEAALKATDDRAAGESSQAVA